MGNIRIFLIVFIAASLAASSALVSCSGSSPTGTVELSRSSFASRSDARGLRSTAQEIGLFQERSAFEAALKPSSVRSVSQNLSSTGTEVGGGAYELQLGAVRIRTNGPAFYGNVLGVDVLSKGVPVTLFFPPNAQGAGVEITQLAAVKVTALAGDGESFVLDRFSNGSFGFLGFTSPSGIVSIELSDPDPSDASTPITNLADVVFGEVGSESRPMNCAVLRDRRPSVRVTVEGKEVTVAAVAHGVGVPGEVDAGPAIVGSVARFRLWPNGRHREPQVTSAVFPSMTAGDFPAEVRLRYRYPDETPPGEVRAALDYELLSACFDELTGEIEIGGLDEFGTCRPGTFVILQCDRGLTYAID